MGKCLQSTPKRAHRLLPLSRIVQSEMRVLSTVLAFSLSAVSTVLAAANGTGPIVDLGYARYEGTVNATLG